MEFPNSPRKYEQIKLILFSETEFDGAKLELGALEKSFNKMERIKPEEDSLGIDEPHQAGGSELRLLRQILQKADPSEKWGGLERVLTPEGHIIWLDAEHKREYKE